MSDTASDFLVLRLHEWGIRGIYGFPGDGINGVFGALDRHRDKIEFIQARHEEEAAFMATAHAKFTGEVGVCIATSGPGSIGLPGTKPSWDTMTNCDTLFMVGICYPERVVIATVEV